MTFEKPASIDWRAEYSPPCTVPREMSLGTFIASHLDEIMREWETAAKAVAPPHALTREALRDHWAEILKAIGEDTEQVSALGQTGPIEHPDR